MVVKRIFRYLKGTPNLGLWYPKGTGFEAVGYIDADFVGCRVDRKIEAEYIAAGSCCAQVLWIRNQLMDYGLVLHKIPIMCDNTSAISIVGNPLNHSRIKHIDEVSMQVAHNAATIKKLFGEKKVQQCLCVESASAILQQEEAQRDMIYGHKSAEPDITTIPRWKPNPIPQGNKFAHAAQVSDSEFNLRGDIPETPFSGMINCFAAYTGSSHDWILDSGASNHMTPHLSNLQSPIPVTVANQINLPTGATRSRQGIRELQGFNLKKIKLSKSRHEETSRKLVTHEPDSTSSVNIEVVELNHN
ncbi:hypothetical protein AgCh_040050 [Apium graveolens]